MTRHDRWRALGLALALFGTASGAGAPGSIDFFRGKLAYEAGKWKEAGRAFAAAGKAGYKPADVHYWMGKTYQQMNKAAHAQKHYEAARDGGLRSHDVGFQLARIHFAHRRYAAARTELDALPTSYQRMDEVALMRGSILLDDKQYDEAYALMKKAVRDFPYKVHTASGYFPELQSLSLAELSKARMAEIESGAAVGSTEDVDPAPDQTQAKAPRVGGLTRFGSEAAFKEKERGTETYKMHGYESRRGWEKNSGGAVIKGSKNWGAATMSGAGGS